MMKATLCFINTSSIFGVGFSSSLQNKIEQMLAESKNSQTLLDSLNETFKEKEITFHISNNEIVGMYRNQTIIEISF